jgi:integrase
VRVKEEKRTVVPLSIDEVARFWSSVRTSRDLAIVGLMLLQGLRSREVLALNREDVSLTEAQICVHGKGGKTRLLPLAPESIQLIDHYLRLERPDVATPPLFVSLKGGARAQRMTPAGLRALFRHHRQTTGVQKANPHRFRHTLATDMVPAGVSLPALMRLMGHASIQSNLIYIEVTPLDVYTRLDRGTARNFLVWLGAHHPEVISLDQLRRDPHILGWMAGLRSQVPPLVSPAFSLKGDLWHRMELIQGVG